jgi:hypothetical protein
LANRNQINLANRFAKSIWQNHGIPKLIWQINQINSANRFAELIGFQIDLANRSIRQINSANRLAESISRIDRIAESIWRID